MSKLLIALVLSILLLIIVLQNLQIVSFNFLIWSFSASLAVLIILTFVITVIISILIIIPYYIKKKLNSRSSKELNAKESQEEKKNI